MVVLPQPLSPTKPEGLAWTNVEAHPIDGLDLPHTPRADDALDDGKVFGQPVDRQQGICHGYPAFPSSTLRTDLPHWMASLMGVPVTALATMSGRMNESSMIWMNSLGLAGQPRGRPYWPSCGRKVNLGFCCQMGGFHNCAAGD